MVGEKAAVGFGRDRIRTPVYMATVSSHRIKVWVNVMTSLPPYFLIASSSFLQVTGKSRKSSKSGHIRQ